jgi:glycosyltransferase involved in cell wall biosynthesis
MEKPLITTIIPTYNRSHLLRRAISSVCNQTVPHFQVCVYDNASSDETEQVVRESIKNDSRIKYHRHTQNIGMMGNYKYALSLVNTPYFSLLSDDDLLFPEFYEETMKGFAQFPDAIFSATSTLIISTEKKINSVPLDQWDRDGYFQPPEGLLQVMKGFPVPTSIIFRREVLDLVPIDFENPIVWDPDFLIQISSRFPIFTSKKPTGILINSTFSFSCTQKADQWSLSFQKMKERFFAQSHLSMTIKNMCLPGFDGPLKDFDKANILYNVFQKNFEKAYHLAIDFSKKHGIDSRSIMLLIATKMSSFCPSIFLPTLIFLKKLKGILKFLLGRKKNFSCYKHYVKRHYMGSKKEFL